MSLTNERDYPVAGENIKVIAIDKDWVGDNGFITNLTTDTVNELVPNVGDRATGNIMLGEQLWVISFIHNAMGELVCNMMTSLMGAHGNDFVPNESVSINYSTGIIQYAKNGNLLDKFMLVRNKELKTTWVLSATYRHHFHPTDLLAWEIPDNVGRTLSRFLIIFNTWFRNTMQTSQDGITKSATDLIWEVAPHMSRGEIGKLMDSEFNNRLMKHFILAKPTDFINRTGLLNPTGGKRKGECDNEWSFEVDYRDMKMHPMVIATNVLSIIKNELELKFKQD